jgi:hypothetical protein
MDISKRFLFFNLIKQPHETYESMGPFTSYYLNVYDQRYDQDEEKPWFLSWNWACFFSSFFGAEILWLLYRRMYLFAFLIYILGRGLYEFISFKVMIFGNALAGPILSKSISWIFRLGFTFGFTVVANALYFYFLSKKVEKNVKTKGTDPFTPIIIFMIHAYIIFMLLPSFLEKNPEILAVLKNTLGDSLK